MHALEQETKLEIPGGWVMPDLSGVLPGVRAELRPVLDMVATYYDTDDRALDRHRVTLRLRRETPVGAVGPEFAAQDQHQDAPEQSGSPPTPPGHVANWTIKLPGAPRGSLLSRTEVNWPVRGADKHGSEEAPQVPPLPAGFLTALTLGRPLRAIARLQTARQRAHLLTSDGRMLAEVAYDCVTGTNLVRAAQGMGGTTVVFSEVEVELAHGSALEVAAAIVDKLCAYGAKPSKRASKLATVMSMTQSAPVAPTPPAMGAGSGPAAQPGQETRRPKAPPRGSIGEMTVAEALHTLQALRARDLPIRLVLLEGPAAGTSEDIHQARVSARRARTVFQALARQTARVHEHRSALHDDGAGHGLQLPGPEPLSRDRHGDRDRQGDRDRHGDRDQHGDNFEHEDGPSAGPGPHEDPPDGPTASVALISELAGQLQWYSHVLGAVRDCSLRSDTLQRWAASSHELVGDPAPLLERARQELDSASRGLQDAMNSPDYISMLRRLDHLAADPLALGQAGAVQAEPALARLGALQLRRVRRKVRKAVHSPTDHNLHRARIQAKKLRYLGELAASVTRGRASKQAGATARRAEELQDILGEVHDLAETARWLGDSADGAGEQAALAAGQLIRSVQRKKKKMLRKWERAWSALDERSGHAWPDISGH